MSKPVVAIVGLGYVGLPLAIEFGGCVIDVKGALDLVALNRAGATCWRL